MKDSLSVLMGSGSGASDAMKAFLSSAQGKFDIVGDFTDALRKECGEWSGNSFDTSSRWTQESGSGDVGQGMDFRGQLEGKRTEGESGGWDKSRRGEDENRPKSVSQQTESPSQVVAPVHNDASAMRSAEAQQAASAQQAQSADRSLKQRQSDDAAAARRQSEGQSSAAAGQRSTTARESAEAAKATDARSVRKGGDDAATKERSVRSAAQAAADLKAKGKISTSAEEVDAQRSAQEAEASKRAAAGGKPATLKKAVPDKNQTGDKQPKANEADTTDVDQDAALKTQGKTQGKTQVQTQGQVEGQTQLKRAPQDAKSAEAMAKLRQRNPSTEVTAERETAHTISDASAEVKKGVRKAGSDEAPGKTVAGEARSGDAMVGLKHQALESLSKSEQEGRRDSGRDAKDSGAGDLSRQGTVKVFKSAASPFAAASEIDIEALRKVSQRFMDARPLAKESKNGGEEAEATTPRQALSSQQWQTAIKQPLPFVEQKAADANSLSSQSLKDAVHTLASRGAVGAGKVGGAEGGSELSSMFGGAVVRDAQGAFSLKGMTQARQGSAPYTDLSTLTAVKEVMNRLQAVIKDTAIDKSNFSLSVDTAQMGRIKLTIEERNDTLHIRVEVKGDANKEQFSQNKEELAGEARKFGGYRQVDVDVSSGGDDTGAQGRMRKEGNDNVENVRLPGREEFDFAAMIAESGKDFSTVAKAMVAGE